MIEWLHFKAFSYPLFPLYSFSCQTADIYANVMEDVFNIGLGEGSDAFITRVGDASLSKVDGGAGSTVCGGSLEGDFINDKTGSFSDLSTGVATTVCGQVTHRSYECTQDECLNTLYNTIVDDLTSYIHTGTFTTMMKSRATTRLPPVPELQVASAAANSLSAFGLLLPATISSQLGDLKYFKDNQSCGKKTAFAAWEAAYDTLQECCAANFNWQLDQCCSDGGGCGGSITPSSTTVATSATTSAANSVVITTVAPLRYYASWTSGQLCSAKATFDTWETSYFSLKECCTEKFNYSYEACCQSSEMGGCVYLFLFSM